MSESRINLLHFYIKIENRKKFGLDLNTLSVLKELATCDFEHCDVNLSKKTKFPDRFSGSHAVGKKRSRSNSNFWLSMTVDCPLFCELILYYDGNLRGQLIQQVYCLVYLKFMKETTLLSTRNSCSLEFFSITL